MASEWHYTRNGQQAPEPVSSSGLRQLASSGQLLPTDLVWQEGMPNWMPASSVKGLFGDRAVARSGELPVPGKSSGEVPVVEVAPEPKGRARKRPDEGAVEEEEDALHPAIHLVLTCLTGGLWGLWVGYSVCRDFSEAAPHREADASGRPLGKPRHPVGVMLLSYLTCGLYFAYWVAAALRECSLFLGQKEYHARTEMTLALVFPVYTLYVVLFRLPDAIRRVQTRAGLKDPVAYPSTVFFLSPCVIWALPALAMTYQDALNQAWANAP
jgi:hypothetical protein